MLRRIFSLLHEYGDGEPELDYKGLVDRAGMVRAISSSIKWYDWKRYSSKQDIKMLMGGIVGFVIYQGFVDEFLPLFEFCEIVHIGKQTSFGLGKFRKEVHRMQ
jgi:CRISPR/Cas system endoribonuclease Cas6 (RAMP superfamily)